MGPSPLYQVSCRMTMSVFLISLMNSRFLLFRPKADDLRPWIFQDEIVKVLCSIKCPMLLVVWCGEQSLLCEQSLLSIWYMPLPLAGVRVGVGPVCLLTYMCDIHVEGLFAGMGCMAWAGGA